MDGCYSCCSSISVPEKKIWFPRAFFCAMAPIGSLFTFISGRWSSGHLVLVYFSRTSFTAALSFQPSDCFSSVADSSHPFAEFNR